MTDAYRDFPPPIGVRTVRPSTFAQYRTLLARDLRQEFRTREMLSSMGIYAVLVLVIFGASFAQVAHEMDLLKISGGLIWALIVFTSLLGLNRSFSREREEGALEGVLLVPLDRSIIFLAKATANLLFLLTVELITLPLFFFLFLSGSEFPTTFWMILGPLGAGSVGIAGVGTLLATMTANTRGKDVLLAVLFIPLAWPLLYACVVATTAALLGPEAVEVSYLGPVVLALGYDVILIAVSWLLYDFVVSA
ncbi:MAG: heme exporter protein CcmB [Coriobacteriales bacterium]|jgi:heme exporter protein B|nr:heme exporter protein CcmB [Coriobacteriales bacterium]